MSAIVSQSATQTAVISTEHTLCGTGDALTLAAGFTYVLQVDLTNLASGDTVELRPYVKAIVGGAFTQYDMSSYNGVQTSPVTISLPVPCAVGVRFTLKQTTGTGRAFPWAAVAL